MDLSFKKVAIIVPHFQTFDLICLCLRSIRKFTHYPYEVIVVDNHSQDDSLCYLRSLKWITLITRRDETEQAGSLAHQAALDIGVAHTEAPYILSIHSDTIVKHPQWLNRLVAFIEEDERIGAIGTWKLEVKSPMEIFFQRLTDVKRLKHWLKGGASEEKRFIRTHCSLYRSDLLKKLSLRFLSNDTAGKNIHEGLIQNHYEARFIPVLEMMRLVDHLNHATLAFQRDVTMRDWKLYRQQRKIRRYFNLLRVREILLDDSLDQ